MTASEFRICSDQTGAPDGLRRIEFIAPPSIKVITPERLWVGDIRFRDGDSIRQGTWVEIEAGGQFYVAAQNYEAGEEATLYEGRPNV